MKHYGMAAVQIAVAMLLILGKFSSIKPIHFIAGAFFTLMAVYAAMSLCPILSECVSVIKSHMNIEAVRL